MTAKAAMAATIDFIIFLGEGEKMKERVRRREDNPAAKTSSYIEFFSGGLF